MTNSTEEGFSENVELYSRSLAMSGFKYKKVKEDLNKLKNVDPKEVINSDRKEPTKKPGAKVFWISKFDPRVPHPRKIISKNYHLIKNHPIASKIFPRENIVAGSKRPPNLSEILSPTVQPPAPGGRGEGGQDGGGGGGDGGGGRREEDDGVGGESLDEGGGARHRRSTTGGSTRGNCNPDDSSSYDKADSIQTGSYHCKYYKKSGGKCDVCGHMKETNSVLSKHFERRHAIHGRNTHLPATMKDKLCWFVYLEEDLKCELQYIGSTTSMTHRWANTKKKCNLRNSNGTGLETHFKEGYPRLCQVRMANYCSGT